MSEQESDYITEGLQLLHGEPSIEVEAPRKVTERRGGQLVETERSAFVKLYTSFKGELKDIDGNELKVWLYLALSINRYTKDARPGLRKIAEDTGMAVNTVRGIVEKLEERGLLDVDKADGKGSIYHPADYVSVSKIDTVTVSKKEATVSNLGGTVSASRREFAQLEELESTRDAAPLSIENAIYTGQPVTEEMVQSENLKATAPRMFEKALGFSKPLPWGVGKEWTEFHAWVCERYAENRMCFGEYNIWRNTPFTKGGMSNNRIRGFVTEFYDSWDMFTMGKTQTPQRGEMHGL